MSTPQARTVRRGSHRIGWHNLGWKLLLALLLLLLMLVDVSVPGSFFVLLIPISLLLWGGLFIALASFNLFGRPLHIRLAWCALTLGAYLALLLPGMLKGTPVLADALGPVAALTLVPHLGRHDLSAALRDWAALLALSLYTAIGILSMWLLITTLRLPVFFIAVLFPPLLFEMALFLLAGLHIRQRIRDTIAVLLPTFCGMAVFSFTQFHPNTPLYWSLLFSLIVGSLIGGALLISLLTRSLVDAASGGREAVLMRPFLRSFVELTYSALLLALALYIPLQLLGMAG